MGIEVEKLIFSAEAELKHFERDMQKIPQIVEDVSRKANQKAAKSAAEDERIQKGHTNAVLREQKQLTNGILKELDKRDKAEAKAANKRKSSGASSFFSSLGGKITDAIPNIKDQVKDLAIEGIKLNATLDNLVRFTATLDKNFQTPVNLFKFKNDILQLSTEIPHSAEKIAEASFSIKSAFSDLDEPQTIEFLRQFGLAATASNTDIAEFTKNTIALAKVFKVEIKDLPTFMAKVNATFKDGLAADSDVAQGYNQTVTSITALKLSMEDYLAVMSTVQSTTANAAEATTNIKGLFDKLADGKTIEDLKKVFNIERFNTDGSLKTVNQIINEIGKSLEGLPDDKRLAKIFSVFGDRQARDGLLALVGNLDKYNERLKDTNGAESFKATQDLMLGSVESRWTTFWNNIKADQTGVGSAITDFFLTSFDSTTVMGGIFIFFNNIGGAVVQGMAQFATKLSGIGLDVSDWILSFFFDEKQIADYRANFDNLNKSLTDGISSITDSNNRYILENQKKYWQKIADSTADSETKQKALSNVQSLTKSIQQSIDSSALVAYQSWEKIGKQAIDGLKSSEPAVKAQAEKNILETLKGLQAAINDNKNSAGMKQSFADLFKKLSDSVTSGDLKQKIKEQFGEFPNQIANTINAGKPQMQSAVNNLLQVNTNIPQKNGDLIGKSFVVSVNQGINSGENQVAQSQNNLFGQQNTGFITSSGYKIGTSLWQGIVQGLNSGHDNVAAASSSLVKTGDKYARLTAKSHSPSELFADRGKEWGQGIVVGVNRTQDQVIKAVTNLVKKPSKELQKTITKQVKDLQKEAQEAVSQFEASLAGYGKTSQTRAEIFKANEQQSLFDDIIRMRNDLGISDDKPLIAGNLEKERNELEKIQDRLSNLKSTVQSFRDSLPKDNLQTYFQNLKFLEEDSTSDGFRKTAESMGLTVAQLKELSKQAFTAEFIKGIDQANEEFEKMSSEIVTEGLRARAEAVKKMSDAFEMIGDEDKQQEYANSIGIKVPKITVDDSEPPPQFKKAKYDFETLAGFIDRTFTDLREGGWRGMLEGMLFDLNDALQKMFVSWISSSIFKALNQPVPANQSTSGGGIWSKVLNWGISALFGSFGGKLFGGTASKIGGLTDSTKGIITNIPGMNLAAEGGSFSSGDPVIVGEQGWELFIPKTSGTIYNQRQLKSMSYAPNYNFPKSYAAQLESQRNAGIGGAVYHAEIHNHFHANKQTGAFSRASAEQTANQMSQLQQHAFKRSNKTN